MLFAARYRNVCFRPIADISSPVHFAEMTDETLRNFVATLSQSVADAMADADQQPTDSQYRLGVRRLAKAFVDTVELFELAGRYPELDMPDVDDWYAGRQSR
jgi:hypothetical protein